MEDNVKFTGLLHLVWKIFLFLLITSKECINKEFFLIQKSLETRMNTWCLALVFEKNGEKKVNS